MPRVAGSPFVAATAIGLVALLLPAVVLSSDQPTGGEKSSLERAVEQSLRRGGLRGAQVAVLVQDASTGEIVYQREPDAALVPASVTKIVTAAAALTDLSPQFTFESGLYSVGRQEASTWIGDVYLVARGDPSLVNERIWVIVSELRKRGIARIDGSLIVDDSYFDDDRFGHDWGPRTRAWYHAPHGAVSVNFNTVSQRGRWVAIADDPSLNAGRVFVRMLRSEGVELAGEIVVGRATPAGAKPLALSESKALTQVIADLNKVSNNFIAEQILKTLGAEQSGAPGTSQKGLEAVSSYLARIGITEGFELHDGSGLSKSNRLSPRAVTRLLSVASRDFEIGPEFVASLKVAGVDGSKRRFQDELCHRRMRVKTGHLYGTAALAGFAETSAGRSLVFAILVNDYRRGRAAADQGIEELCHLFLADGPPRRERVARGVRRGSSDVASETPAVDDELLDGQGDDEGPDDDR